MAGVWGGGGGGDVGGAWYVSAGGGLGGWCRCGRCLVTGGGGQTTKKYRLEFGGRRHLNGDRCLGYSGCCLVSGGWCLESGDW